MPKSKNHRVWLTAVNMGYGHQRAAFPLRHLAYQEMINANDYADIPESDKKIWESSRHFYEFISRFSRVPLIGQPAFDLYDKFQAIPDFYPKRDLSRPSFQLKEIMAVVRHKNWGRHLIAKFSQSARPLVTSFFAVAFMAEYFGYQGDIYCVICDADIARVWADLKPRESRINYFAPCYRVMERLKLYGVPPERIFLTGFPLPKENLGGEELGILRHDLGQRLINLDPAGHYLKRYSQTVKKHLGLKHFHKKSDHPFTLTFAVGGAGAQREIGGVILKSLKKKIIQREIRLNLIAGTNLDVKKYFNQEIEENGLNKERGRGVRVLFQPGKIKYFTEFNRWLRTTDVLWTKPSELSFYPALGLPIIMAPPIGSQEKFNRLWLKTIGAGISQNEPRYTDEWLFDWQQSGWLAQAAMRGFIEAPRFGTYNIEKILLHKPEETQKIRTVLQY